MITVDRCQFTILPRDWGEEVFIEGNAHYLFKRLDMRAGTKGGLQQHVEKDETFYLCSGVAIVRADRGDGTLVETQMDPGEAYHIPPGATHQVEAVTDCVFFEASTPHYNDRVRMEAFYGLPTGGGLPTTR